MDKLIEKTIIGLIVGILSIFMILLILSAFQPSCEDLGGKQIAVGVKTVIINKFPHKVTEYECIQKEGNK